MIKIDGSLGEGGGQILRSAITLSLILNKPIEIFNIRTNRSNPGLRPQHFSTLKIISKLFNAEISNLEIGSQHICFRPKDNKYEFVPNIENDIIIDIGTAGSIPLLLQTLIPSISISNYHIKFRVIGGTDVKTSPTIDYIRFVLSEAFRRIGIRFTIKVIKRGYYPNGGGIIDVEIFPSKKIENIELLKIRKDIRPNLISVYSNLPKHVSERQISAAISKLEKNEIQCNSCTSSLENAESKGCAILIYLASDFGQIIGVDQIGERGIKSEEIGKNVAEKFVEYYLNNVSVDDFLADMIILPLSLSSGRSIFTVKNITNHFKTNLQIINQFLDFEYNIKPIDNKNMVTIDGINWKYVS